ncbi:hypothetical protein FACS1894180_7500 [Bacteroidia bacterium]|nr:hypothetical protein FACS1894178_6600 [Bacteroidia bacterium]GHV45207.1 hypothetical protein FACS1894180_7500 [Bacteroidia bacterium]
MKKISIFIFLTIFCVCAFSQTRTIKVWQHASVAFQLPVNQIDSIIFVADADVDCIDPTEQTVSLIGTIFSGSWNIDTDLSLNNYEECGIATYQIDNITLYSGEQFKFRLNHNWDTSWGANISIYGDSDNFTDYTGDHNFLVGSTKTYTSVVFQINFETNQVHVYFNP